MKGRDGDYPPERGTHMTRVFSVDEFPGLAAYAVFALSCGIEPDERPVHEAQERALLGLSSAVVRVDAGDDDSVVRVFPNAFATCTCRWARPAVTRIMARSAAFVHRALSQLSQ